MFQHLTEADIERFINGTSTSNETTAIAGHIATCAACAGIARRIAGRGTQSSLVSAMVGEPEHPSMEEIVDYVDGVIDPSARPNLTRHIESCAVCYEDFADARFMRVSLMRRTASPNRWPYAAAIVLALLIPVWVFTNWHNETEPAPFGGHAIQSVAFVPLLNESSGDANDFLRIALADAVTTKLQQIPAIVVPSMSSVLDIERERGTLPVDLLFGGSFLVKNDLVRVTIDLKNVHTGARLWSRTIIAPRADLRSLVDQVTGQSVGVMASRFGLRPSIRASVPYSTDNLAFEDYLKARSLQNSLIANDRVKHLLYLRTAIKRDPRFAAAYADLSIALSLAVPRGMSELGSDRAEQLAAEALKLDPILPIAHLAMARAVIHDPNRLNEGLHEAAMAVKLNPKEMRAIVFFGAAFSFLGDADKTAEMARYLLRNDARSTEARTVGYWYLNEIRPAEALRAAPYAMALPMTELAGNDIAAQASILSGDLAAAKRYADRASVLAPSHYIASSLEAMVAAANEDRETSLAALHRFEAEAGKNHYAAERQSLCYARLGDRDRALAWMRKSAALGNIEWWHWTHHPWVEPLQSDPRFGEIAENIRKKLRSNEQELTTVYNLIHSNE